MAESYLSPSFVIGAIRIGTVEAASCINLGNNWPTDFRNSSKHNQGFGNIGGDNNVLKGAQSMLNDPDVVDMVPPLQEDEIPLWIQNLVQNAYRPQPFATETPPLATEVD